MPEPADAYTNLTEEELAELQAESELRPGEDATAWQRRAAQSAERFAKVSADRGKANAEAAQAEGQ